MTDTVLQTANDATFGAQRAGNYPSSSESQEKAFEQLAQDVDEACGRLFSALNDDERKDALAFKQAIEAFHRPALVQIVRTLRADPQGKALLFELVDDPHVRAVFGLHGIIKVEQPEVVSGCASKGCGSAGNGTHDAAFIPVDAITRRATVSTS